ncbi:flagellar motor switch phosphatase FliY [Paenibacillus thermotolerans]|uniref:flagellar motor switch phosphatase FliY n=1 Tax=Paenibacillus thermotolerans TaxID=3027807 RepID=UPI002367F136|nr:MULTISPECIES: flagellar motor switch phosphatase FliY [unclassified Paenibacillus]
MTNKDYLSQEEIDALLRQSSEMSDADSFSGSELSPSLDGLLTEMEKDALGEIGNITFGSAATALSTLLGRKVDITTPKVSVIPTTDLSNEYPKPHVAVSVNYVDGFQGINMLVIRTTDAQIIADLMLGGDGQPNEAAELNEIHISAVQEAMNQMMGSSATSMSTIFNRFVNISPPGIDILTFDKREDSKFLSEDALVQIKFRLIIGDLIDSNIMQLLPISFAKELVSTLMGGEQPASAPVSAPASQPQTASAPTPPPPRQESVQPPAYATGYDQTAAAANSYPPQSYPPQQHMGYPPPQPMGYPPQPAHYGQSLPPRSVQQAQFSDLAPGGMTAPDNPNLNLLLDIPLKVTVELGRTQRLIKDILELSQGSIIELDKLAGEPVDILVNNKLIAKGEVVVIDENFGVRVTDIVSQWDRIQKLQ